MPETHQPGAGKAAAVVDAGMIQAVAEEEIVAAHQGGDEAGVGHVAGTEGKGRLFALEPSHRLLQLMVQDKIAAHQAGRAGTGAKPAQTLLGRGDEGGMFGQTQVVIGGEIEQLPGLVSGKGKSPFAPAHHGAQASKPAPFPLLVQPVLQIDHNCLMSSANFRSASGARPRWVR